MSETEQKRERTEGKPLDTLRIERLFVRGFRNLARVDLEPGACFNIVYGDNGAGKSNLLESIGYLVALRSFRGARNEDMVSHGANEALLKARVLGQLESDRASARTFEARIVREQGRSLRVDGKRPRSIGSWYAALQGVVFHPGDLQLSMGGAAGRRSFVDRILEQTEGGFDASAKAYEKALRSRNRLLREGAADRRAIGAFDEILATQGEQLGRWRGALLAELGPIAEQAFRDVTGEGCALGVSYRPRVEPSADALREALRASFERDRARGFTTAGPHGDDIELGLDATLARHHASQGQHRAIVLALKVAELELVRRRTGRAPLLLLDDVSSELDRERNRRFFGLLSRMGGQVFLTTTRPELIGIEGPRQDYYVKNGEVVVERARGPATEPAARPDS